MPRRNRVDPFGDLHAVPERGMFTGNRGCLVDETGQIVRHHRGNLWITCVLEYGESKHPLDRPGTWTPLFFLDEALALAAGHRPCGFCRREDYLSYQAAVAGEDPTPSATELNRMLGAERLKRGRGLARAADRLLWTERPKALPDGTLVVLDRKPYLIAAGRIAPFTFAGWGPSSPTEDGPVEVLTPPTSVQALRNGYEPKFHESAPGFKSRERE